MISSDKCSLSTAISAMDFQGYLLNWTSITFVATFHGLALRVPWFFSWHAVAITVFLDWWLGSLGICLGYHRLLSHRSLLLPKWLEYILAISGALALQGGPIFWFTGHRQHHAFAEAEDKELEPYSAKKGFWWSQIALLFYQRDQFFDCNSYKNNTLNLSREPYFINGLIVN
ncbi:MAG: hypothetical protein HC921_11095 [Synechococcaceae cyanobacterium SM2_3_1]|nr:hypothetical protein [Synechococcaceae cyanobacterium SM2_3_1]